MAAQTAPLSGHIPNQRLPRHSGFIPPASIALLRERSICGQGVEYVGDSTGRGEAGDGAAFEQGERMGETRLLARLLRRITGDVQGGSTLRQRSDY